VVVGIVVWVLFGVGETERVEDKSLPQALRTNVTMMSTTPSFCLRLVFMAFL